jgi:ubiquinone/menaquinone biosynthesis C-methylase UbiE
VRWFVISFVLGVLACGRDDGGNAPPGADRASDRASDQAKFDKARNPEAVVKALGIGPGSRVADIGASTGLMSIHLARAVAPTGTVVATDIEPAVLELLREYMSEAGLGKVVEPRVVSKENPGLEPAAYDAILLGEVDNYFEDPVGWLKLAMPALKPGGRIVITNRINRREKSIGSAIKAGLVKVSDSMPTPSHFIAVFVAPPAGGSK